MGPRRFLPQLRELLHQLSTGHQKLEEVHQWDGDEEPSFTICTGEGQKGGRRRKEREQEKERLSACAHACVLEEEGERDGARGVRWDTCRRKASSRSFVGS